MGWRWGIVALYAVLAGPAAWLALRVQDDSAIDKLIVESDPDFQRTRAFRQLFPEARHAVLVLETPQPYAEATLQAVLDLETRLAAVPGVQPFSLVGTWRRLHPGGPIDRAAAEAIRRFATNSALFRRQGLVGDGFVGVALALDYRDGKTRDAALAAVEQALTRAPAGAFSRVRRVGGPFVDAWLERETHRAALRYFPLFGVFVVGLVVFLFRSWRALAALLLTLGVSVLLGVATAGLLGYGRTIVSALVPLTVLITTTATLVYIHSRFVDRPDGVAVEDHHPFALANKLLACTASVFAAAVGFAALGVSHVRPIRELGWWTALALVVSWAVCFTLFPALQSLLRTPTGREGQHAGRLFLRFASRLPELSYRWRWALVGSAVALWCAGMAALFGAGSLLAPMRLETDALDYVDRRSSVFEDATFFGARIGGLSTAELWIRTPTGAVTSPAFIAAVDRFAARVEGEPGVGSVVGLPALLRFRRYAAGEGETLPADDAGMARLGAELEMLLLEEPAFAAFVSVSTLADIRLTVIGSFQGESAYRAFAARAAAIWAETARQEAGLEGCSLDMVGLGLLQAKIAGHLVPTLVESFAITAGIIFVAFILVFRSGVARVMALIPSLFAILATFLVMRLTGMALNVATILIASTVLGASENDQIHFFYHFQEGRRAGSVSDALAHTLRVSGQAILYATLINAGGFLALAFSPLPPMRQFGLVSALAFSLSMLADFTALPASLWILMRERPDAAQRAGGSAL